MLDPQDNTFPIPGADNTQMPAGGSVVPPVANTQSGALPMQPQPGDLNTIPPVAPAPVQPFDTAQSAPVAPVVPNWQNQAVADASQLPVGPDNYSISDPIAPAANDMNAQAPVANTLPLAQDALSQPTPYQPGVLPPQQPGVVDTYGQSPASTPVQYQVPPMQPSTLGDQGIVPPANMLDLSQQALPPMQPGEMQPGVPVQPDPNMLVQSPQIQSVQDTALGALPPDFGMSNNAIADGMANQEATKSKRPMKFIIIGVVVVAFITILSLIVLFSSRNSRQPAIQLNDQAVTPVEKAQDTQTTPGEVPNGYKAVVRDCFTFGILLPTTVDFAKTTCQMGAQFGSVSQYNLTITPVTETVTNLQSLVDKAKTGTISTQDDIKLGGVEAKKIIVKVNGLDQQTVAVIPASKTYQIDGKAINGFLITTSYNDDTAKKASEVLISSWVWK